VLPVLGLVLRGRREVAPFGEQLCAAPISTLWRLRAAAAPVGRTPVERAGETVKRASLGSLVNLVRVAEWFAGTSVAKTRCSRFAALQTAA
jgi:hypothetical protein